MRFSTAEFSKSFFNIGAGYDIQPMLRFTHVTDTFIYCNLYLFKSEVSEWYDSAFRESDFEVLNKEVVDDFNELEHFEISQNYRNHLQFYELMNHNQYRDYLAAFKDAEHWPQYAIVYTLKRKSSGRIIKFYFVTAEGLASYQVLSQNGLYAPKILCTIKTDILEFPEGIIDRLFSNPVRKKPELWVRGFEPSRYMNNSTSLINKKEFGFFSAKVLDFNHQWICGNSYENMLDNKRLCKGFACPEKNAALNAMQIDPAFQDEKHTYQFQHLNFGRKLASSNDWVVLPRRMAGMVWHHYVRFVDQDHFWHHHKDSGQNYLSYLPHPEDFRIIFWEDILPDDGKNFIAADQQVRLLIERLHGYDIDSQASVHIIPFCLEDEGRLYHEALLQTDFRTVTYLPNLYDFIDLKSPVAPASPQISKSKRLDSSSV